MQQVRTFWNNKEFELFYVPMVVSDKNFSSQNLDRDTNVHKQDQGENKLELL